MNIMCPVFCILAEYKFLNDLVRFLPTPGQVHYNFNPNLSFKCLAGPTPETISNWGEFIEIHHLILFLYLHTNFFNFIFDFTSNT